MGLRTRAWNGVWVEVEGQTMDSWYVYSGMVGKVRQRLTGPADVYVVVGEVAVQIAKLTRAIGVVGSAGLGHECSDHSCQLLS